MVGQCSKKLHSRGSVKYLGVKIDADLDLNWQFQVNDLSVKLNIAKTLLFKIRKYVSPKILSSIYFLFSNPTYLTALLSGLRILELFNGLQFYKKRLLESL